MKQETQNKFIRIDISQRMIVLAAIVFLFLFVSFFAYIAEIIKNEKEKTHANELVKNIETQENKIPENASVEINEGQKLKIEIRKEGEKTLITFKNIDKKDCSLVVSTQDKLVKTRKTTSLVYPESWAKTKSKTSNTEKNECNLNGNTASIEVKSLSSQN